MLMLTYKLFVHEDTLNQTGYICIKVHTYLAGQVVPGDQCLPSPLCFLGLHLGHLVLVLHPDHPSLGAHEQCIYWVC